LSGAIPTDRCCIAGKAALPVSRRADFPRFADVDQAAAIADTIPVSQQKD
jgi:hypothetical protein